MFDFLNRKENKEISNEADVNVDRMDSNEEKEHSFALYLLFSKPPKFNSGEIRSRIEKISNGEVFIENILEDGDTTNSYGYAKIDGENFQIVGFDVGIPPEICDYTINCAYGNREELQAMAEHTYHIIAFYRGKNKDYNVIYNAFAKLAYGFAEDNFVGMANGYAWNVIAPSLIKGLFEDEMLEGFVSTPAMMVWRNFVKIPYDNKVWFVTKGNNIYGVHEYAYKGESFEDSQMVYDMFEDIFNYEYSERPVIEAGHTLQLGDDVFLKFRDVYEIEGDLQGEGIGTLVIELIGEDEINKQ